MRFDIVTIFPAMVEQALAAGVVGRAIERATLGAGVHDLRAFTTDRHRVVDDVPYGGGGGSVDASPPAGAGGAAAPAAAAAVTPGAAAVAAEAPGGVTSCSDLSARCLPPIVTRTSSGFRSRIGVPSRESTTKSSDTVSEPTDTVRAGGCCCGAGGSWRAYDTAPIPHASPRTRNADVRNRKMLDM